MQFLFALATGRLMWPTYRPVHAMPFTPPAALSSHRLTLRLVEECDLADLLTINGDDAVTRYLPYSSWKNLEDGRAWLRRMQTLMAQGDTLQFVIVERASRRVIGSCLLFRLDAGSSRAEIGYVMGHACWRQGFCAEALRLLVAHAFDEMPAGQGLRRLEAQVDTDNTASNALLAKIGFHREGILRERWISHGQPVDTMFHGLLQREWQPR